MNKLFLLLLAPFWVAASSFTLMDYNVENLFDLEYSGSEYHDYIPNTSMQWNKKNYTNKLQNIAKVISDVKADIVTLEEIESDQALKDLQNTLTYKNNPYKYRAITTKKKSVVHTALLSKFPILAQDEIIVNAFDNIRSILVVTLDIKGNKLTLFINHWKSKGGPESKRLPYAKALKKYITSHKQIKEYIITGDLNANYNEYKTFKKSRRHNDTKGITGINHILKTLDKNKLVTKKRLLNTRHFLHYNLWMELPKKKRWSHNFYGKHGSLDHIIIPRTLFDNKGIDYVKGSFKVFNPRYLISKKNIIQRWKRTTRKPIHYTGKGYSDHLPLVAQFKIKK